MVLSEGQEYQYTPVDQEQSGEAFPVPELASRGSRLLAVFLDGVFLMIPALLVSLPTYALSKTYVGSPLVGILLVLGTLAVLAVLIVQIVFLASNAQTIGKKIVGIAIFHLATGERAGFARIVFLRWGVVWLIQIVPVVGSIFALVDILAIFTQERRCIHDRIADTSVLNVSDRLG